jgi:hypothetical protein
MTACDPVVHLDTRRLLKFPPAAAFQKRESSLTTLSGPSTARKIKDAAISPISTGAYGSFANDITLSDNPEQFSAESAIVTGSATADASQELNAGFQSMEQALAGKCINFRLWPGAALAHTRRRRALKEGGILPVTANVLNCEFTKSANRRHSGIAID